MRILRPGKYVKIRGNPVQNAPIGTPSALGCIRLGVKVAGERVAFSTHRAA